VVPRGQNRDPERLELAVRHLAEDGRDSFADCRGERGSKHDVKPRALSGAFTELAKSGTRRGHFADKRVVTFAA
jgi:hypothetical protein